MKQFPENKPINEEDLQLWIWVDSLKKENLKQIAISINLEVIDRKQLIYVITLNNHQFIASQTFLN